MRRTAAVTATSLLAALAIGGPLAGLANGAPATLHCATAAPPAACAHLDDLAAQLAPTASVLGPALAPLTGAAQGFSARSDSAAGVPTGEVVLVSTALLDQLGQLPDAVEVLLGTTALGDLTGTLEALLAELTAPVAPKQEGAGAAKPTPARTGATDASPAVPRSSDSTTSLGGSATTGGSSAPSGATVPDVPVGDPLTLAPLALPDFGFSQTFEPVEVADLAPAPAGDAAAVALAEAVEALPDQGRGAELAVVVVLSLLLIAGAGVAQVQQNRHTIPD